ALHTRPRPPSLTFVSLDDQPMKSVSYTPGYIYLIAIILALPATWLVVGRSAKMFLGLSLLLCSSASLLSRSVRFVGDFKIAVPLDKLLRRSWVMSRKPSNPSMKPTGP